MPSGNSSLRTPSALAALVFSKGYEGYEGYEGNMKGTGAASVFVVEDFETRGAEIDHQDLRLWLRMMTIHKLINNEARRRLRVEFGMSLPRFDLMSQLDGKEQSIRMGELSSRLMVTTGNITGLTNEL